MMQEENQLCVNKTSKHVLTNIAYLFRVVVDGSLRQELLNILGHELKPHKIARFFDVSTATAHRSKKRGIRITTASHHHTGIRRKQFHTQDLQFLHDV